MQTEWKQLQAALEERQLSFETPQALLEWVDAQQSPAQMTSLLPNMMVLQRLIVALLQVIIEDTDSAAHSIITEASSVDTDTERLGDYLKNIEQKTTQSQAMRHESAGQRFEVYSHKIVHDLSADMEMLRALSGYVRKVSDHADEVHASVHKMIAVLSFKAIMDAAIAEDKTKNFAQIAGEVRALARQSADQSDEILKFIDEMQLALSSRLRDIGTGIDVSQAQAALICDEIQSLLASHDHLRQFLDETIAMFNESHNDIEDKVRMIYAQVQFQDIVRQKAERGIDLIESGLQAMQQCLSGQAVDMVNASLSQAIASYSETERLHVHFSHSGVDVSHGGANMKIDLF
ncbi:MAG: hypothetical protein IE928_06905 [Gammaproteobacteria bacterium]|nr:hypothetical protein [Gammaproteobacteria bacterium]